MTRKPGLSHDTLTARVAELEGALREIADLCPAMFHDGATLAASMRRLALLALETEV